MPIIKINSGMSDERKIGFADIKTKIFTKWIYKSKHIFKALDAIGIDADYFTTVLLPKDYTIKVIEKETGNIYSIKAKIIKKKGEYYHFKNEKSDDRAQIFCPRKFWELEKPKTKEEKLEELAKIGVFG